MSPEVQLKEACAENIFSHNHLKLLGCFRTLLQPYPGSNFTSAATQLIDFSA